MVNFERFTLSNGLRVVIHRDPSTPIAALNVLYNAGSRVEDPSRTGMAHLFEHLMFSGSQHVDDFDVAIQHAGGDANAFTNSDITNFYDMLPVENLETALWLESDRMMGLELSEEEIDVQKKVVIEEFKETCLDQPYGNLWHLMAGLAYTKHPYRWPTIGLAPEHIAAVEAQHLRDHFSTWYRPNNAILAIAGDIQPDKIMPRVEAWFGSIPSGPAIITPNYFEPEQLARRELTDRNNVPVESLYMGFHCPGRMDPGYYATDLLTDILANGPSSRLYRRLVMEKELFSHIGCYQNGTFDPGMILIEGKPTPGISLEAAEAAIWHELLDLTQYGIPEKELTKIKHKNEAAIAFSQVSVIHKAMNLAYFEWMDDASLINREIDAYQAVTVNDIRETAFQLFQPDKANVVFYRK